MANLSAELSGSLAVKTSSNCSPTASKSGRAISLELYNRNTGPDSDLGSSQYDVNSPNAFVGLPIGSSLRVRVFGMRVIAGGPFDVRLTQATAGQRTIDSVLGVFLIELDPADELTAIDLQGSGQIEWLAFGPNA